MWIYILSFSAGAVCCFFLRSTAPAFQRRLGPVRLHTCVFANECVECLTKVTPFGMLCACIVSQPTDSLPLFFPTSSPAFPSTSSPCLTIFYLTTSLFSLHLLILSLLLLFHSFSSPLHLLFTPLLLLPAGWFPRMPCSRPLR